MTHSLFLHSERFPPSGGLAAQGALNLLGRPDIDLVTLLFRETGQNSWDARKRTPVSVAIALQTLDDTTREVLTESVFGSRPPGLPLDEVLRDRLEPMKMLSVSDRGTVGLGGPTRADVAAARGQRLDFVEFMRNFGQVENEDGSGGTYGYGRTAAYLASKARTICVYTRWDDGRGGESRLMASGLGQSFETGGHLYTGRHWWGRLDDDIAEPLVGEDADRIAKALGLRVMQGSETGTDLVVIAPHVDDSSDYDFGQHARNSILWNFWPKMVAADDRVADMQFSVTVDGASVEMPAPSDWEPTRLYANTYLALIGDSAPSNPSFEHHVISDRYGRDLGDLAVQKEMIRRDDDDGDGVPYGSPPHRHAALLRAPRLVVKYLEGPQLESEDLEYAAVFVANDFSEPVLRRSETPVHDDWTAASVSSESDKRIVNAVIRRLADRLREYATPTVQPPPGKIHQGLGAMSQELGIGLLPGAEGEGASPASAGPWKPGSGTPKRSERPRVVVDGHELEDRDSGPPLIAVRFTVSAGADSNGTLVSARVAATLDDGTFETDPPAGSEAPVLVGWRAPDGHEHTGHEVLVDADDSGTWVVLATRLRDVATGIDLTAEPAP